MTDRASTAARRGLVAAGVVLAALATTACEDGLFYEPAAGIPVALSVGWEPVDLALASTLAEAFDQADAAHVTVVVEGATIFDEVVPLVDVGADKAIEFELELHEAVTASVHFELMDGSTPLFGGSRVLQLSPGAPAEAAVPVEPVQVGLAVAQQDTRIRSLGDTLFLSVDKVFANGSVLAADVPATWTSDDASVAVAGSGGAVVGLRNGETTVRASVDGLTTSTPVVVLDKCVTPATPYAVGQTVSGEIDRDDCFLASRLRDRYGIALSETTAFRVTMSTTGVEPLVVAFRADGGSIGGYGFPAALEFEYVLPAGTFGLEAAGRAFADTRDALPVGSYTLATQELGVVQTGCQNTLAMVTFGSTASGALEGSDCVDEFDPDTTQVRRWDGYAIRLRGSQSVTVTLTADVPIRLTHWVGDTYVDGVFGVAPGTPATITASGDAFHAFYPITETEGEFGNYTITFSGDGGLVEGQGSPGASATRDVLELPPAGLRGGGRPPS